MHPVAQQRLVERHGPAPHCGQVCRYVPSDRPRAPLSVRVATHWIQARAPLSRMVAPYAKPTAAGTAGTPAPIMPVTNPIESLNGSIAHYTRNVKRRRDREMTLAGWPAP
jgi:hypothetical protein